MVFLQYIRMMASTTSRKRKPRRETRVPRTFRLRLSKLEAAKKALGAANSTEAIETALDIAVFRQQLIDGTDRLFGLKITSPDPEE